jgi:hypothetical protein
LATLAHAINNTMPIVPIRTHSISPTPPTTSSFDGWSAGVIRQLSIACRPKVPGGIGHAFSQIGSIRAMSAFASATVAPDLRRARPRRLKPSRATLLRLMRIGKMTSACGFMSRNRKPSGMTPTISAGRESTVSCRPITDGSPPNRRCQ